MTPTSENAALLTCLIFTAREWQSKRSGATFIWAQHPESNRDWYFPTALTNDREEDFLNLPRSVMLHFEPLPAAHFRNHDVFAYQMGIAQMDEADLNRDWVAARAPGVIFRAPKDECDGLSF